MSKNRAIDDMALTKINIEPYGDEEESEQKASEGRDVRFYLVLVLRLCQQQSSEESAKSVRETDACVIQRRKEGDIMGV